MRNGGRHTAQLPFNSAELFRTVQGVVIWVEPAGAKTVISE